jgi:hypothetical protein
MRPCGGCRNSIKGKHLDLCGKSRRAEHNQFRWVLFEPVFSYDFENTDRWKLGRITEKILFIERK